MIVTISTVKLHRALSTIAKFAPRDVNSPLCLVRVEGDAGGCDLRFVATSGHALAVWHEELAESLDEDWHATYTAPSVLAAVAAIAPYAKSAEREGGQCSLFQTGISTIAVELGSIACEHLRAPLEDAPDGVSFPPWRGFLEAPTAPADAIYLNAKLLKEAAGAFASVDPNACIVWRPGADPASGVIGRSPDVPELTVLVMPMKPDEQQASEAAE